MRRKVFIINNSGHDFSQAEKYGDLVFLSSGKVDSFALNRHFREFVELMKGASEGDYILVTSLSSLNLLAGWIMGHLGFNLNVLIFKESGYISKRLVPNIIFDKQQGQDKEEKDED